MTYWILWSLWNVLRMMSFPLKVYGKEHLPRHGSFIIASNHSSYLDPLIIGGVLPRYVSYMAKESLFKNRAFAFLLKKVGAFPVKRDSADIGAIKEALKRLKAGSVLVIFPEGTRHVSQKQTHPGIALLAVKSGVPIVPVYIKNSEQVLSPGSKWLRRRLVSIYFGKPKFFFKEMSYQEVANRIVEEIRLLGCNLIS